MEAALPVGEGRVKRRGFFAVRNLPSPRLSPGQRQHEHRLWRADIRVPAPEMPTVRAPHATPPRRGHGGSRGYEAACKEFSEERMRCVSAQSYSNLRGDMVPTAVASSSNRERPPIF